jgi:hypothetical protein
VIVIAGAKPLEGRRVMPDNHSIHVLRDSTLPCIILAHSTWTALLSERRLLRMHAVKYPVCLLYVNLIRNVFVQSALRSSQIERRVRAPNAVRDPRCWT